MVAVVRQAAANFGEDKAGRMALAIAYRALFALSPLILLAVSIAGFFFRREQTVDALVAQAVELLGEGGGEVVAEILTGTAQGATTAGLVGLALLIWTGSSLFVEVRQSLDDIFRTPDRRPGGIAAFVRTRLIGFASVLGLGLVLIALVALNLFVAAAERFVETNIPWLDGAMPLVVPLLSMLLLTAILPFQFQWFTTRQLPWRAAWWGGAVTAVFLVLGGLGLGWYLSAWGTLNAGAFTGAAIIVLFLVAALAQAYLFGAEITRVLADENPLTRPSLNP
jgi:membrane protein